MRINHPPRSSVIGLTLRNLPYYAVGLTVLCIATLCGLIGFGSY